LQNVTQKYVKYIGVIIRDEYEPIDREIKSILLPDLRFLC
jgi:hypothetical protein